jgi:hypothetical protein
VPEANLVLYPDGHFRKHGIDLGDILVGEALVNLELVLENEMPKERPDILLFGIYLRVLGLDQEKAERNSRSKDLAQ